MSCCCPKCSHEKSIKAGIVNGRQRWKCKGCGYHYTVLQRGADAATKRQALELYLEGLGFRSIGRILKYSHVSIYNWIREFGEKLDGIRRPEGLDIVEIDEMHTYIAHKKTIAGYGLLLIEPGTNSSILFVGGEIRKQEKGSGVPLKTMT